MFESTFYEQHLIVLKTFRDNFLAFLPAAFLSVTYTENNKKLKKNSKIQNLTTWRLEVSPDAVLNHAPPAAEETFSCYVTFLPPTFFC